MFAKQSNYSPEGYCNAHLRLFDLEITEQRPQKRGKRKTLNAQFAAMVGAVAVFGGPIRGRPRLCTSETFLFRRVLGYAVMYIIG